MKETSSMRINEIDIAKGLGIIMVIMGHSMSNAIIQTTIPAIHMPLFFILSGLLIKPPQTKSIKKLFINESKLIKIYYLWSIIYIVFHYIINRSIDWIFVESYQTLVFWGIEVLWFIATLIFAKMFINIFSYYIKNKILQLLILSAILLLISYVTPTINTWPNSDAKNSIYLYYLVIALLRIPTAMFFLSFGQNIKDYFERILKTNSIFSLFMGILCIIIVFIFTKYNGYVDMHFLRFGKNIILYILFALLGSIGIIYISHGISKIKFINTFFVFLGKYSLVLMLIHFPILNILNICFPAYTTNWSNTSTLFLVLFIICFFITLTYSKIKYFYHKKRG